jgi:hypothetical protein
MPTVTGKGEQRRINLLWNADVNYFVEDGALIQKSWLSLLAN